MFTIGCIGCGNMGGAIMHGIASLGQGYTLLGVDRHPEKLAACGVTPCAQINELAQQCDVLLLAVKPHAALEVLQQAVANLPEGRNPVVVSVAAGLSIAALQQAAQGRTAVVRCMPNTPVAVSMGAFALCFDDPNLDDVWKNHLHELFGKLGRVTLLAENMFAAFSALMGCGPAYIFYVIDALAEMGVRMGFSRSTAQEMVAWLCMGSAALALQPQAHPAILREQVCSPAGSTIEGVAQLDAHAVRTAFAKAVQAAWEKEKSRER